MRKSTKKDVGISMGMTLEEVLRHGARTLLQEMAIAEVEDFIANYKHLKDDAGYQRIVRNGYHNPREILWGGGKVEVEVPRARDRKKEIVYKSKLIPRYLRRAKSFSEFIPYLYLRGISTGDFSDVLSELLGEEASLSAGTVVRLKEKWMKEYEEWNKRDLSQKSYVYWWADGVYFNVRLEDARCCMLINNRSS
ncbi:MAG: transposase [Elusimicrobiota bacterium]